VAGAKLLREQGIIAPSDRVVCILTGHQLKDPTATVGYHAPETDEAKKLAKSGVSQCPFKNEPIPVENDLEKILHVIRGLK
jgi:threonine synthase